MRGYSKLRRLPSYYWAGERSTQLLSGSSPALLKRVGLLCNHLSHTTTDPLFPGLAPVLMAWSVRSYPSHIFRYYFADSLSPLQTLR
jgi:hypothetical protein